MQDPVQLLDLVSAFPVRPPQMFRAIRARLGDNRRRSASSSTTLKSGSSKMLADFVSQIKNRYLQDVEAGKGGDWIVAMGNEAGGE